MRQLTIVQELRGTATEVGPGLFDATLAACDGGDARLVTQLSFSESGRFREDGRIELGAGDALHFRTVVDGCLTDTPDPSLSVGAAVREIVSGSGTFAGAAGQITSIWVIDGEGTVSDREVGLVFVAEGSPR
jgi:hypothetical protein